MREKNFGTTKTILLFLFCGIGNFNGVAQIIKTDTLLGDHSKFITKYERNRTIEINIFNSDTFVIVDNSLYYSNFIDSLKHTAEYVKRDTISSNVDFMFIHISHFSSGCFYRSYIDMFFYFDSRITNGKQGIMMYTRHPINEKSLVYLDKETLTSIRKVLNNNMTFNINGIGKEKLPDQRVYITSADFNKTTVIAKENNRLFKNTFTVGNNNFGFGANTLEGLEKICIEKMKDYKNIDYQSFFEDNKSILSENEYLQEMVKIFKTNN